MTELIIDFSQYADASSLFTGRENGKRAKKLFHIEEQPEKIKIISAPEQLVTSSYFLGLLGDILKKYGSIENALNHLEMSNLSDKSRDECIRAVKRGLSVNGSLV